MKVIKMLQSKMNNNIIMLFILQWSVHIDNVNPWPKLQMHPLSPPKKKTRMQWYETTPFEESIDIFNTVSAAIIT